MLISSDCDRKPSSSDTMVWCTNSLLLRPLLRMETAIGDCIREMGLHRRLARHPTPRDSAIMLPSQMHMRHSRKWMRITGRWRLAIHNNHHRLAWCHHRTLMSTVGCPLAAIGLLPHQTPSLLACRYWSSLICVVCVGFAGSLFGGVRDVWRDSSMDWGLQQGYQGCSVGS